MSEPGAAAHPSDSGLFDGVLARGPVREATGDRAWLQAMLDFEAALARALARAGLASAEEAQAIGRACRAQDYDVGELGRAATSVGNPAEPLVRALIARLSGSAAGQVHRGATSQDVLDTAMMLVARGALDLLLVDLHGAAGAAAALADRHRATPMAGRTLLQQALPISFGLQAAGWLAGLDDAAAALAAIRAHGLAAQLGGAAGTLASLGDAGPQVLGFLADEVGLPAPELPWHTARARVGALAGALGVAAGTIGKAARDVVLLAQSEVAEVREGGARRGGSSAMPHKRNPVAAVSALACAARAPGLVATLLGVWPEHQRGAGPWQAEWRPLGDLLVAVGSAAAWLRDCLTHLIVDQARMRANLDRSGGLLLAERVAGALAPALGRLPAHDLVAEVAAEAASSGLGFGEALAARAEVRARLSPEEIQRLLDPTGYLGSAQLFVDRALAAYRARGPK
ncbi:MAG TPA: 3-carboxy-cis,cis-muconate cycloisomerase [Polyangia bacterium]|jgi:3-carboxy-cis,cis-muconate cycloisomerase|nr:3-carboxy-cis,cis-muconate cycloisomerase [Polyangia bacterium]